MRKIYYFPGLISAVVIPILFLYYISPHIDRTVYSVIDIGLPSKNAPTGPYDQSSFEPLRNWDYQQMSIDPNEAEKNSELHVSQLKKLGTDNKKNSGIEFVLSDRNTYGDFVSVLNDLHKARMDSYAVDAGKTGHIFALHEYISPVISEEKEDYILCGTFYTFEGNSQKNIWNYINDFTSPQQYVLFTENLVKLPQKGLLFVFGFLILLHISMLSIRERFQIQY
ncbi:hypothetical protein [Chryseobacterium vaccae]|uniref:hypothetical protein n=1 Tax=Chryseobacterium vaccae TaxID=2604424 RepID=UPI00129531B9|nr:hypothetical protein [Chryseobacterium vaccae]